MWQQKVKFSSKVTQRFWADFVEFVATPKSSNGNRDIHSPPLHSWLWGILVCLGLASLYSPTSMTGPRAACLQATQCCCRVTWCKGHIHTADFHQHRGFCWIPSMTTNDWFYCMCVYILGASWSIESSPGLHPTVFDQKQNGTTIADSEWLLCNNGKLSKRLRLWFILKMIK